jgi:YozE SAM-like fold
MTTSSFKQWLPEAEATHNPAGHLILDLKNDDELPDVASAAELLGYMERCGACTAALKAVPRVWKRYQRWLRARGVS